jgi:hypothetical protein
MAACSAAVVLLFGQEYRDHIKARPALSRIKRARANAAIISRNCFIGAIIINRYLRMTSFSRPDWKFQYLSYRLINYRAILYNVENIYGEFLIEWRKL